MKKTVTFLLLLITFPMLGQVGINTTLPEAQLDVRSSNQATPSNTDGLLIPKVDNFPLINPTLAQQGMLVYLTTTSGTNEPGFYYWDDTTVTWKNMVN
jgi:trimeric autotransporter adhesin